MFYYFKQLMRMKTKSKPFVHPVVHVYLDVDDTLLINSPSDHESFYDSFPHLTKSPCKLWGNSVYLIHTEKTKQLMQTILAMPNVKLGFITSAEYHEHEIKPILEHAWNLPEGRLNGSHFFNAHRFGYKATPKGYKLKRIKARYLAKQDEVVLVDNDMAHLDSAKDQGFKVVLATGFLKIIVDGNEILYSIADDYLDRTLEIVEQLCWKQQQAYNEKVLGFRVTHAVPFNATHDGISTAIRPAIL